MPLSFLRDNFPVLLPYTPKEQFYHMPTMNVILARLVPRICAIGGKGRKNMMTYLTGNVGFIGVNFQSDSPCLLGM